MLVLLLFPFTASASSFLECTGIITLKHKVNNSAKKVEPRYYKNKLKVWDILVHEHTFSCKGHGASLPKGVVKKAKLLITANVADVTRKAGDHFKVKYQYGDSAGFAPSSSWTVTRRVNSIPLKKAERRVPQTPRMPKYPAEGLDIFVEETSWDNYKGPLPVYEDFTRASLPNEGITYSKEFFTIYRGTLFEIIYPKAFITKPTKPVKRFDVNAYINEFELDENEPKLPPKVIENVITNNAYFTSPDGLVEFYVYAKDSTESPDYYTKVADNEIKLSSTSTKHSRKNEHLNYVLKGWTTFKAKDGSYYRSHLHQRACHDDGNTSFNDCETQILGIKYKNIKAYQQYRNKFIGFAKSLLRTSDL